MKIPTVRMCKDGTLKCKELIEEPGENNLEGFNGKVVNNTLVLNNGYKIAFTSGNVFSSSVAKSTIPSNVMSVNFYIYNSSQTLSPSGFQLSRVSGTNNFTAGLLNDSVKTNYNYKGPIRFGFYNAYVEETSSGYDYSYFPAGTTWFSFYNSKNELMFYSSVYSREYGEILVSNETFINLVPYEDRFTLPTVRVFKDGTIKCAKVQEATLNYDYVYKFNGTVSGNTITFNNGIIAKFYKGNTSTQFIDIPDISYLYFSVDGDITKGQPAAIKESEIQISSSDTNVWEGSEDSTARTMTYPVSISQIVLSFASASLASYTNLMIVLSDGISEYQYNQGYKEGTNIELYPYNTGIQLDTTKRFSYSWANT